MYNAPMDPKKKNACGEQTRPIPWSWGCGPMTTLGEILPLYSYLPRTEVTMTMPLKRLRGYDV